MAGGACSAYRCYVMDGALHCQPTTTLRSQCVAVAEAVNILSRGETVLVQGSDMAALRQELGKFFVR